MAAYLYKEHSEGQQMPGSSWCHRGKREPLWSLSDCGEDIFHKAGHQPEVCRSRLHRLEEHEKETLCDSKLNW